MDEHQLQKGRNRSEYEKLAEDVRAVLPEISVLELGRKELGSLVVLTTWHPATLGCLVASSTLARTVLPLHPGGDGPVATMGLIFYALARMGLATDIGPLRNLSAEQLKDALSRASRENVIPEVDVDEKTMLSL